MEFNVSKKRWLILFSIVFFIVAFIAVFSYKKDSDPVSVRKQDKMPQAASIHANDGQARRGSPLTVEVRTMKNSDLN